MGVAGVVEAGGEVGEGWKATFLMVMMRLC